MPTSVSRTLAILVVAAATLTNASPLASAPSAEVVASAPNGFSIRIVKDIRATPDDVFRAIGQVNKWWDSNHTWSGSADNLTLDLRPGGCFCETLPGGGVQHMVVTYADQGHIVRLHGGLGPMSAMAVTGALTFTLSPSGGATNVEVEYAVGGYAPSGLQALAKAVDGVLMTQVSRLAAYVETGTAK